MRGEVALRALPVLGADGGESVPLALAPGRAFDETAPPNWLPALRELRNKISNDGWGSVRRPIFITSSNFGVGSLYAYRRHGDAEHLKYGTPHACVEWLAGALEWGTNITTVSHACVSAHLGLLLASRALRAGLGGARTRLLVRLHQSFRRGRISCLEDFECGFPLALLGSLDGLDWTRRRGGVRGVNSRSRRFHRCGAEPL